MELGIRELFPNHFNLVGKGLNELENGMHNGENEIMIKAMN